MSGTLDGIDPTRRVLVVGAGPAGLSAAMHLRRRGYNHVTVLEKTDKVGGKCHSLVHEGIPYDLGANLTTPRYEYIRPLAERLGLTLAALPERRVVSLGPDQAPAGRDLTALQRLFIRGATQVYIAARATTGIDGDGYGGLGPLVREPFSVWLARHGLTPFREIFANLFIAYGYGVMDDLPAAYALKFFDPVHIHTAVSVIFGDNVHTTRVFAEGFQELWVRVVRQWDIDVRTSATIGSIRRGADGIAARWTDERGAHDERFDALILACPLDASLEWLDATDTEHRLFSHIEYYDYYVTAAILRGIPDVSTFVYPFSMQFTPGWPTVFYPPVPGDPHDVFMFYSYGDRETTVDQVRANLKSIVERPEFGGKVAEFLTTKHWRYFPHVSSEAMKAGFYDDLEALQGTNRTFYAGEVLSFTLVELVARYSKHLVERWF